MKRWKRFSLLVLAIVLVLWLTSAVFLVQETQTAIVTRFSKPLTTAYQPGPHLKLLWPIDKVIRFERRLLIFNHEPTEFLTQDKKNILVDSFAVWRIANEHNFLSTVRNQNGAEARLLDMITAALGEIVGKYPLASFINTTEGAVKFSEINREIHKACAQTAQDNYGVEIVDVRINSFNFPQQNRLSVIKRMQAERDRIATQYRSEGDEEALKIEATTDMEVRRILAEANREAKTTRGKAEAEAIKIYGRAYGADPDFYRFLRTLEAYNTIIDKNTTIILRSDSELWRMIGRGAP